MEESESGCRDLDRLRLQLLIKSIDAFDGTIDRLHQLSSDLESLIESLVMVDDETKDALTEEWELVEEVNALSFDEEWHVIRESTRKNVERAMENIVNIVRAELTKPPR